MYDNFFQTVNNLYIIIYARLSKEECGKSKEDQSKSIKNQINICRKFIEEEKRIYSNCQFKIVDILNDDGISGTTFDRNDFKKLINLIETKQANMVITKDLSRLGRDHIKTDDYIEKWFPEHNVRYVSILENVDTYADCVSNDIAPIINWSNDNFAKITSKKIKKQFEVLRNEGKWTGGEPPIGYQIDPKQKYHFIKEPYGEEVVKKIFDLAKNNYSLDAISNILIKDKIPIPTVIKGNKRIMNNDLIELWSTNTIKKILQNEIYLGHMIQGKTTRLNHKSKTTIYLPKEKWIKIENTHEPIIDKQTFDTVQRLIKSNKNKTIKTYDYLLKGLIRCSECNHSIGIQHYSNRKNNYTICNYYRKYGRKKNICSSHRFQYELLEEIVLKNIKDECFKFVDTTNFINILKNKVQINNEETDIKLQIDTFNKEIEKLNRQIDIIYEDKLNRLITVEQYQRIVKKKQDSINYFKEKIKYNKNKLIIVEQKNNSEPDYQKIINNFLNLKNINKSIITKLIDAIYINENGTINIHYNFINPKSATSIPKQLDRSS